MRNVLVLPILLILVSCASLERAYQHDKDIIRLRHLAEYGRLIEEYYDKTGKYPIMDGNEMQHYVFIAKGPQKKQIVLPPYPIKQTSVTEFEKILEDGLGRDINLLFDPQQYASGLKPLFYLYMTQGDAYYMAIHLYNNYPFARKVANNYFKVEISNYENPKMGIWTYKGLMADPVYIAASSRNFIR